MISIAVYIVKAEGGPFHARDRPGDANRGARAPSYLVRDTLSEERAHRRGGCVQLVLRRRIGVQEPLGEASGADVETVAPANPVPSACDQLGRATADVHDHGPLLERPLRRDAAERQQRLLVPRQQPCREAVAPLDLAEERLTVLGVANRARRDRECSLRTE